MQCGWSIIINQSQRSSSAAASIPSGRVKASSAVVYENAPRETAIVEGICMGWWPRPELHPGTTVTQYALTGWLTNQLTRSKMRGDGCKEQKTTWSIKRFNRRLGQQRVMMNVYMYIYKAAGGDEAEMIGGRRQTQRVAQPGLEGTKGSNQSQWCLQLNGNRK